MRSIFAPRFDEVFNKKTGEVELVPHVTKGQGNFDKYYIDYEVKYVPVPISEGSDDYVLEMRIKESKRDIVEIINSQAEEVGLEAMLDKFQKTGDPSVLPSPVTPSDAILDLTKLPQDGAEYFEYIHGLAKKFESLPIDLRGDMTLQDFIKSVTDKQVNDWLQSVKPVDKKEGDN